MLQHIAVDDAALKEYSKLHKAWDPQELYNYTTPRILQNGSSNFALYLGVKCGGRNAT